MIDFEQFRQFHSRRLIGATRYRDIEAIQEPVQSFTQSDEVLEEGPVFLSRAC